MSDVSLEQISYIYALDYTDNAHHTTPYNGHVYDTIWATRSNTYGSFVLCFLDNTQNAGGNHNEYW